MIELPRPALFLAGKAFMRYRCQGGNKGIMLVDFFMGANAAVSGYPVLTRDTKRYAAYFPRLHLVAPEKGVGNELYFRQVGDLRPEVLRSIWQGCAPC